MSNEDIEIIKQQIASELRAGLMERFVGEKVDASTMYNVKAYVKSFMRRYGGEEYRDIPRPVVSITGNEITIFWEKP